MKFLCDQMLVRLGRWLRAAGYDTTIAEGETPDRVIFQRALEQGRVLITRDRHFLEMGKTGKSVVWLQSNSVEGCATELSSKVSIDWLKKPFSRCMLCNSPLKEATSEDLKKVPERILEFAEGFQTCLACQKVFWLGSHTDKMLEQLKKWSSAAQS